MVASSLQIEYSDEFYDLFKDDELTPMLDEMDDIAEDLYSTYHGYNFTNMFKLDEKIDMNQKSVSAFYFDRKNKFAGFDIYDHKNEKTYSH